MTTSSEDVAITMATLASTGTENISLTANTGTATTTITTLDHEDWSSLTLAGDSAITITSTAIAAIINTIVDGSTATGVLTLDFAASTTNGISLSGGSAGDTLTGTAIGDAVNGNAGADVLLCLSGDDSINGGDGADTITGGAGSDAIDLAETTSAIDTVILDQVAGLDTITGFVSATDIVSYQAAGTGNGGEVVVTAAAAQGALTDDRTYVIEQKVGAVAELTTGGTETIADFTDMADVAAYLDEAFTNSGNVGNVIVLNNGASSYIYQAVDVGTDTSLVGEIVLIGTVDAVLANADVAQV